MTFLLQITRKLMTSSFQMTKGLSKRANPGLGNRISAIEDSVNVIESDPEGFDGLESDLFNAHQSHKKHELNLQRHKENIRLRIVKNKYFRKDHLPNLLTYAEKDQIRFLHSSDGEEWTVDKLADSFPASAETIRLILKSRWSPMSAKRIHSHDANVLKNWERLKNGELNESISPDLREHLEKFANGRISSEILEETTQFRKKEWQKPNSNEFSSIISSLQSKSIDSTAKEMTLKAKPKVKRVTSDSTGCETYLTGEIKNKKPITIHQLKIKHLVKNNDSMKLNENEAFGQEVADKNNISGAGILAIKDNSSSSGINIDYSEKFATNEIIVSESDSQRYGMSSTKNSKYDSFYDKIAHIFLSCDSFHDKDKEFSKVTVQKNKFKCINHWKNLKRIHIPRKLWRKGATYCTNNCYYDDDGEFLYKVLL